MDSTRRPRGSCGRGVEESSPARSSAGWSNPDDLFEEDAAGEPTPKRKYEQLPWVPRIAQIFADVPKPRWAKMYATGLERGNSSIGYVAISTIFLREHNRLCRELARRIPTG